jgi:hypothetical protein
MDTTEFALLQEGLMWALGPMAMWMAALLLAFSVLSGVTVAWMMLLRRLTSGR